jgi:hypothetical protein
MKVTGDTTEVQYYILENFFFWHSKEKTLLTLNMCLIAFIGLLPMLIIPVRYFIVAGLWGIVSLSSPLCIAISKSLIQIMMEYGIVLERTLPVYTTDLLDRIENVYIPRTLAILRWVPIVRRYVPS